MISWANYTKVRATLKILIFVSCWATSSRGIECHTLTLTSSWILLFFKIMRFKTLIFCFSSGRGISEIMEGDTIRVRRQCLAAPDTDYFMPKTEYHVYLNFTIRMLYMTVAYTGYSHLFNLIQLSYYFFLK